MITAAEKKEIIDSRKLHEGDSGSSAVQIALLTFNINGLQKHFSVHKRDLHSRRGLLDMVSKRRRLLDYLKRKDQKQYQNLIKSLGLRR